MALMYFKIYLRAKMLIVSYNVLLTDLDNILYTYASVKLRCVCVCV
jgi:hypothetical protein